MHHWYLFQIKDWMCCEMLCFFHAMLSDQLLRSYKTHFILICTWFSRQPAHPQAADCITNGFILELLFQCLHRAGYYFSTKPHLCWCSVICWYQTGGGRKGDLYHTLLPSVNTDRMWTIVRSPSCFLASAVIKDSPHGVEVNDGRRRQIRRSQWGYLYRLPIHKVGAAFFILDGNRLNNCTLW